MKQMTPGRMAAACGGIYYGSEKDRDREATAVTTDSRKIVPGCLFAAIKGERVDGHSFIPDVLKGGALCVLTEQDPPEGVKGNYIRVKSTLEALGMLASYYLKALSIPVIGITGSVGKTSTKEMVAAVLSQKYRVLKTEGNFNNELGLPLTIFNLREEDEIAVLEMGINHFGEMHRLAAIAQPDTCLITNIQESHLEYLKDRDGVLRAKSEIFDFLRPDGHVILNGDDDKLETISEVKGITPVFFGIENKKNTIYADHIEKKGLSGIFCRICTPQGDFKVTVPIPGVHMVRNALAGTAVGLLYGLTLQEIRAGIESLQPLSGRFHLIQTDKFLIIDDCYNANPASMRASLDVLKDASGRRVAILGDMLELGKDEGKIHFEVGEYAGGLGLDLYLCIGTLGAQIGEGIRRADPTKEVVIFPDLTKALEELSGLVKKGDTVLVKASHRMRFDEIVSFLEKM